MAAVRARSEAQRAASRKNGARSQGPRTAAGKARASRNALKHGLWGAVHLVVPGEDPSALDALRAAFAADYAPRGVLAACLADRLALTFWKLSRCDRLEVQLASLPPRPQRGWLEAEPGMPAALSRLPEHAALERARARLDRFLVRGIALLEGGTAGRRPRRRRSAAPSSSSSAPEPRTQAFASSSSPGSDPGTQEAWMAGSLAGHDEEKTSSSAPEPRIQAFSSPSSPGPDPGTRSHWMAGSQAGHDEESEGRGAASVMVGPGPDHPASSPAPEPGTQSSWMAGSAAGHDEKKPSSKGPDASSVMVGPRPDHPAPAPSSPSEDPRTRSGWMAGSQAGHDDKQEPPPAASSSSSGADPRIQPVASGSAAGCADIDPTALLEATARRLLAEGRAGEATAVLRRLPRQSRAAAGAAEADRNTSPQDRDAAIDAALAELSPEARALWDSLGYERWVVPPLPGRMGLASLTNEWVTPADRWRVLEEVRRLGDPAETARVLARFAEAGLDPGRDHPEFVGAVPPSSPASSSSSSASPSSSPGADPGTQPALGASAPEEEEEGDVDRLLRNNPVLRRVVEESDAYHEACRMRHEARRWTKHAEELGAPLPTHALAAIEAAARIDPANPRPPEPHPTAPPQPAPPTPEPWPLLPGWHGRPRDPRTGALLPLHEKGEKRRNEPEPVPPASFPGAEPGTRSSWMAGSEAGLDEASDGRTAPSVMAGPGPDHPASPSSSSGKDPRIQFPWMAGSEAGHDEEGEGRGAASVMVGPGPDHPAPVPSSPGADPGIHSLWMAGSAAGHDGGSGGRGVASVMVGPRPDHPAPAPSSSGTDPRTKQAWIAGSQAGHDGEGAAVSGPRTEPPLPDTVDWPFSPEDEPAAVRDARAAREARPAPAGKTTTPTTPPEPPPWTPARLGPFATWWYRDSQMRAAEAGPPGPDG